MIHARVEMQENSQRVYRFIQAFETLYGRKPTPEDAEGDFKIHVAQEMQMSIGGARYYLRLAAELEGERARTNQPRKSPS
jgi:hypothetical protein